MRNRSLRRSLALAVITAGLPLGACSSGFHFSSSLPQFGAGASSSAGAQTATGVAPSTATSTGSTSAPNGASPAVESAHGNTAPTAAPAQPAEARFGVHDFWEGSLTCDDTVGDLNFRVWIDRLDGNHIEGGGWLEPMRGHSGQHRFAMTGEISGQGNHVRFVPGEWTTDRPNNRPYEVRLPTLDADVVATETPRGPGDDIHGHAVGNTHCTEFSAHHVTTFRVH